MRITPWGAAGEVTGSSFLLESGKRKFLVDCGLFQGGPESEERNRALFFDPKEIEGVFLTHAHLDHCGKLPFLAKKGFKGKIYATSATKELAGYILRDAARVQLEDFLREERKKRRSGEEGEPPLYSESDVLYCLNMFRTVPFKEELSLGNDLSVTFRQAGHILGSASLLFQEKAKSVVFSGDLGNPKRNVVPDPDYPPYCDLVISESTYGDRRHKTLEESIAELREAINWTYKEGGNVIIPSFAMERAQDLLFYLRQMRLVREIPQNPVYLDSPLSINITEVYRHHLKDLDEEIHEIIARGEDPFYFPGLQLSSQVEQSRSLNEKSRLIIIAGSGMCQGGRIVHHLKHNLWRDDSSVIFVGYQARGTLGRAILEGKSPVHILGENVVNRARIYTINGFSAHGDQEALLGWLGKTGQAKILLVHGEVNAASSLGALLKDRGRDVELAFPGRTYEL